MTADRMAHDLGALADLRRVLDHVWPDGWDMAWGEPPRAEDLRKLLGDKHPGAPHTTAASREVA